MTNLTPFIGVGDGPFLQGIHGRKRLGKGLLKSLELFGADRHAADIKPEAEGLVVPEQVTEPLPLSRWIRSVEVGEWGRHARGAHLITRGRLICTTYAEKPGPGYGKTVINKTQEHSWIVQ